jgi:drug/metabolite transporter (DMT)-like permease
MYAPHLDQPTQPSTVTGADGRVSATAGPVAIWLGLLAIYFVWGSTYIGIRLADESIPPFLMAGVRFLLAGIALLIWEYVAVQRLRSGERRMQPTGASEPSFRPTGRQVRDSAIVGGALLLGGMGLVALGERTVPAGVAAFQIALLPVWIAVLGRIFFGERLPRIVVVCILVGVVGVAILVDPLGGGGPAFDPFGLVVLLVSPIFWGSGSLFSSHKAVLPRRPLTATGLQMVCGGALLLVAALITGELAGFDVAAVTGRSFLGLAYLTTVGSLVGFTTYVWLLRVAPLSKVATYAYVNPIVAFVLAGLLLGETIEPRTAVAGAVIVLGVALIVTARGRPGRGSGQPASSPGRAQAAESPEIVSA